MALNLKRFVEGIILKLSTGAAPTNVEGALYTKNDGGPKLKAYLDSGEREIVTENQTQVLTNKTITVANNTVTTAASGNLAATELNAALSELQSDIDTRALNSDLTNHTGATVAHGATGAVVGTTNTQTLTNKLNQNQGGSVSEPAYSFVTDTDSGMYSTPGEVRISTDGVLAAGFSSADSENNVKGVRTPAGILFEESADPVAPAGNRVKLYDKVGELYRRNATNTQKLLHAGNTLDDITAGTTNVHFTAADESKLDGIESGATADQTGAEIKSLYEAELDTNAFTDAEKTKLATVEAGAQITDATTVAAAGAVMESDTSTINMSFVIDEDTMTSNSATKVPTQQSVKAYVDTEIATIGAGSMIFQGNYDASTNTPDLDVSPSGIAQGDVYVVTAAGTFFTEDVEIGDMLVSRQVNPTTLDHWVVVQDNLTAATIKSKYESNADTNAFTDAEKTALALTVAGPASATNNAIVRFDGTTGKLVQNSGITIDDYNDITSDGKLTIRADGPADSDWALEAYDSTTTNAIRIGGTAIKSSAGVKFLNSGNVTVAQIGTDGATTIGTQASGGGSNSHTIFGNNFVIKDNDTSKDGSGGAGTYPAGNIDLKDAAGTRIGLIGRASRSNLDFDIINVGAGNIDFTTNGKLVAQMSSTGACTLGDTGSSAEHTTNGTLFVSNGTNAGISLGGGASYDDANHCTVGQLLGSTAVAQFACLGSVDIVCDINNNSTGKAINFRTNGAKSTGTLLGQVDDTGAWTLGASGGAETHNINGVLKVNGSTLNFWVDAGSLTTDRATIYTGSSAEHFYFLNGGSWRMYNTGGAWYQGNNSASWSTTSDIAVKENVRDVSDCLSKICGLRPRHFNYKNDPTQLKTGFVAQEFEAVLPGHVTEQPTPDHLTEYTELETIKSIDSDLLPYIVGAIKELKEEKDAKIAELEARIATLEGN